MSESDRFENIEQGLSLLDTLVVFYTQSGQIWYGGIRVGDEIHTLEMIRKRASNFMKEQFMGARLCFPELESIRNLFWQRGMVSNFKKWISFGFNISERKHAKAKGKMAEIFIKDILNALFRDIGYGDRFCAVIVPREYDIKNEGEEGGDIAIFYYDGVVKVPICLIDTTTVQNNGKEKEQKTPGFNTVSGTAIPVIILPLGGYDILGYQGDEYHISRFLDEIVRSAIALGEYDSDDPLYFLRSDKRKSFEKFIICKIMEGIGVCKQHFLLIPEHASISELLDYLDEMRIIFERL